MHHTEKELTFAQHDFEGGYKDSNNTNNIAILVQHLVVEQLLYINYDIPLII